MNFMYSNDWEEFDEKFPGAASFIRERTLRNELHHLCASKEFSVLTLWQQNRLADLEQWEQTTKEIRGE